MRSNPQFDIHAMSIFTVFDDVVENMDTDLDGVIYKLEDVARSHARTEGFNAEFFHVSCLRTLSDNSSFSISDFCIKWQSLTLKDAKC